jgi:cell division protein FtsQ
MLFVKRETVNKLLIENKDNASSGKDKVALNNREKIKFK